MLCKHGADDTQSNTSESQLSHGLGGDLGQGLWSLRGLVFSPVNWNQESLSYLPYQVVVKKKEKKNTDKQVIKGESKELTLGAESSWHYCYLRLRTLLLRPPRQKHGRNRPRLMHGWAARSCRNTAARRGALRGLLAQSVLTAVCPSVWKLLHPHLQAGLVRLRCTEGSEDEVITGTVVRACVRGLCMHISPCTRLQGGQAKVSPCPAEQPASGGSERRDRSRVS